jgi:hypothetical protein
MAGSPPLWIVPASVPLAVEGSRHHHCQAPRHAGLEDQCQLVLRPFTDGVSPAS